MLGSAIRKCVTFLDPQVGAEETFLLRIGRFWWWLDDYSYEGGWIPAPEWSEGEVFWNDAPLHDGRRADSLKEHVDRLHELGCEQGGPLVPGQTIAAGVIYSDSAPAVVAWPIWAVTGEDGGEQGGGPGDFLLSSQPLFDTNSCAMYYQVFDEPVSLSYLRDLLETCEPESNVGDRLRSMVSLSDYHAALCE